MRTKSFIIALFLALTLCSCATRKWTNVSNEVNVEELMQTKFAHMYEQYKSGKIKVEKVLLGEKNGEKVYRIIYKEISNSDDTSFLWETIYMPSMNN